MRYLTLLIVASVVAPLLGGCSGLELPYPKASDIKRITQSVLSPDEQNAAIKELTDEQERHREAAAAAEAAAEQP